MPPFTFSTRNNSLDTPDLPVTLGLQENEKHAPGPADGTQALNDHDESQLYPDKIRLIFIGLSLSLCMFLVGLDNTIISSAIPKITDDFHALEDVGWYASAYMLTVCAFQLMWGKLFTFYTIKWVYLASLFIFELGSLICGVAPTSTALIIGRAIAGVGGGGVSNGSFLLIAYSVPPRQRPTLIGALGAMYGFSAIAGPLIGGAFTNSSKLTWRWCFYINLPLGFVAGLVILFLVSSFKGSKAGKLGFINQLKQMDIPGTLCLLPGIICLLLALQWGGTKYPWDNGRIIALLVLAFVVLVVFMLVQARSGDLATVPTRIFCNRNIWGSSLFGSCIVAAFFVMLYYIPIWFQAIKGATPIKSGVMSLPLVLSYVIFSFGTGGLTSVFGYYVQWAYMTVILMAIGCGLLSILDVGSGHAEWIGYQVILGAGVGCGLQTAFSAPQTALPLEDIPIGTAVVIFTENLASAVFVSVAQNVFTNQLKTNIAQYAPDVDASVIIAAGATEFKSRIPQDMYDAVLFAYNKALDQTFYVGVALSCFGVLGVFGLEWLSVKGGKRQDTSDEAATA
ncbi:uncharacterized protein N7515_008918 [Penicillium bovifimosum]|uniref:Major facilitator superfamily (MFS) profile domain-containing protein n=1 Tax=Penicillium bovifimosum TaxID=126998 RepID=A0A9W9KYA1_9EURO|nr:uncharacterized protein N7515_008918 [Penicillium bovifimosum]KAJ5125093.1 hypothetical protein N7515_008918 [Penicillium bovifimosum]